MGALAISLKESILKKYVFVLISVAIGREHQYAISHFLLKSKRLYRWFFYAVLMFLIGFFAQTNESPFIYFQF